MKNCGFTVVLVIVILCGVGLWGSMLWLTIGDDGPNRLLIHLGETGATLAVLTVLGGLVRAAFMEREETRQRDQAKLEFYRAVLADLKSVYDRVESCRLLVDAHQSAKTYGEQIRALVGAVITLHNIKRALDPEFPRLSAQLRDPIREMTAFIKDLLNEYRDHYKKISHLQVADEAWNKHFRERLAKAERSPSEYKPLARAWTEIQKLPKLAVLRDDKHFKSYEASFLKHLDAASATLRTRLPVDE